MTTIVSGAGGFVGRHLVRALVADGVDVVGTYRDTDDRRKPVPGFGVYGDLRDASFCKRIVTDYEVDTIYHLAAHSIVSVCAEAPDVALEVAVMGTANLLEAVRGVQRPIRIVVSTSDKVFGSAPSPYTEETPLDPRGAYEASKACQDIVARMYAYEYGLDVTVVRAVNIYGPDDPNPSRLIPRTLARLKAGEPPVINAGAHKMLRQYVYVDDLVAALRLIVSLEAPIVCVGSPDPPMSAAGVIRILREVWTEVTGQSALDELEHRDGGFREIETQVVDDALLRAAGWEPKVDFRGGVRRIIMRGDGVSFGDEIDWDFEATRRAKEMEGQPPIPPDSVEVVRRAPGWGVRPGAEVVDLGCNVGVFAGPFLAAGYHYTGVDQSAHALGLAKKAYPPKLVSPKERKAVAPNPHFLEAFLWDISLETASFDYGFCNAVLQHNTLPEKQRIMLEVRRVVKPGGVFAMQESTVLTETATQLTHQGWIDLVTGYGFSLIETWHPNPEYGVDDAYAFRRAQ